MGNSVLQTLASRAPIVKMVSLQHGRHRLHAMPTSTGYEIRTDASYDLDGRRRGRTPFAVLQHTVAGEGSLLFERRRYKLTPGDTMLVIIPHNHRYSVPEGGHWEFFWLAMSGQEAMRIQRNIQAETGPVLRLQSQTVETIADCCLRLIEGEGATPGAASAIAYCALAALYDDILGPQVAPRLADVDTALNIVIDYVIANIDKPLPVSDLHELSGFSRAHFSRLFTKIKGLPPAEFVLQERMRRAARLLSGHSMLPIKEIASMTGFADSNYFAKAFRRHFSMSPTEFRVAETLINTSHGTNSTGSR